MKSYKGFTLIELMIVVAIIAILAAIIVPAITGRRSGNASDVTAASQEWTPPSDVVVPGTQSQPEVIRSCIEGYVVVTQRAEGSTPMQLIGEDGKPVRCQQ